MSLNYCESGLPSSLLKPTIDDALPLKQMVYGELDCYSLPPDFVFPQTKKGLAAELVNLLPYECGYPKWTVPAQDTKRLKEVMEMAIAISGSCGIATCFSFDGALHSPWAIGITNDTDIETLVEGSQDSYKKQGSLWQIGYRRLQQNGHFIEAVINAIPSDFGEDIAKHFIARVSNHNNVAGIYGEMIPWGTFNFRHLEGQVENKHLVTFNTQAGVIEPKVNIGDEYRNNEQMNQNAKTVTKGLLQKLAVWFHEYGLAEYFAFIQKFGFNTIELIGKLNFDPYEKSLKPETVSDEAIKYLRVYEIR